MYIIIVGANGIGRRLTELTLRDSHHNIVVIDKNQERCEDIARKFDVVVINADATQEETLDELDIKKADVLITTTKDDATNLLIVSYAKNRGVKNLISLVNQEESKPLYMEKGVKMVKKPDHVVAEMLSKSIKHPTIQDHMSIGEYGEIIRLPILKDSGLIGKTIKEIWLHYKCLIIAIEREKTFIIPTEDLEVAENDIITFLTYKERVDKVVKVITK